MDQLDDVADDAHDQETDADCLRDLDELALVWLGAAVDELEAVLDELLRHTAKRYVSACKLQLRAG